MAVTQVEVDVLEDVVPGSGLVCSSLPVQLKGSGTPAVQLCHLLFQDHSVYQMLVMVGKQTKLFFPVCWQLALRQS